MTDPAPSSPPTSSSPSVGETVELDTHGLLPYRLSYLRTVAQFLLSAETNPVEVAGHTLFAAAEARHVECRKSTKDPCYSQEREQMQTYREDGAERMQYCREAFARLDYFMKTNEASRTAAAVGGYMRSLLAGVEFLLLADKARDVVTRTGPLDFVVALATGVCCLRIRRCREFVDLAPGPLLWPSAWPTSASKMEGVDTLERMVLYVVYGAATPKQRQRVGTALASCQDASVLAAVAEMVGPRDPKAPKTSFAFFDALSAAAFASKDGFANIADLPKLRLAGQGWINFVHVLILEGYDKALAAWRASSESKKRAASSANSPAKDEHAEAAPARAPSRRRDRESANEGDDSLNTRGLTDAALDDDTGSDTSDLACTPPPKRMCATGAALSPSSSPSREEGAERGSLDAALDSAKSMYERTLGLYDEMKAAKAQYDETIARKNEKIERLQKEKGALLRILRESQEKAAKYFATLEEEG